MRTAILGVLAVVVLGGAARGEVLVDTSFARELVPVKEKNGRITGALPKGWNDNSGWAKVWADYSAGEEEGRGFLAVKISRVEDGRVQLAHALPKLDADAYYRLTYTARSPSHTPAEFGIRFQGAPYKMVWTEAPALGKTWVTKSVDFKLGKQEPPVWFMIHVSGAGEVQLANVKLERRSREELVEEIKKKYPEGGPKNLMRQTTFPLGLPCGWSINRDISDGDEVEFKAGGADWGKVPGGAPLVVNPKGGYWSIISAPFEVLRVFEPHTASLYVRGATDGKVTVIADGKGIGSQWFHAVTVWTRVTVPFTPVLLAKAHALRIEATGPVVIDGVQVNAGKGATDFTLGMPCEVHVGVESPARVLFDDEPTAAVKWHVLGDTRGAMLQLDYVDAYGKQTPMERKALDGSASGGEVRVPRDAPLPLGPGRIEARVVKSGGNGPGAAPQELAPPAEVVVYRLKRPRYWGKDAPESPFGAHTESTTRHNLMAKAIGVNWVRLHDAGTTYAGWRYVEKEKGKWTFNDGPLNRYRRQNLKIMGCLATSPNWASHIDKPRVGYFDQFWQPRNLDDYANYVRVIAGRYKGVIDTWDVWNEPWNQDWWAVRYDEAEAKGKGDARVGYVTSEKPMADFARLVDVAVTNAKKVDPSLTVLGVNSTTGGTGAKWTAGIVEADGLKLPDVYCYHQYTGEPNLFPGDAAERGLATGLKPILDNLGGKFDKPVWMTEGSAIRDRIGSGMYKHTFPAGAGEDVWATSDSLCRFVISLMANGVSRVFLYSMHGHHTFGNGGEWRVLVTDEGYLHPSAAAHANMAWLLEDTRFVKRVELTEGLWAYLFEGRGPAAGRSVAVLSVKPGQVKAWPGLAKLEAVDLFGNPVPEKERASVGPTIRYVAAAGDAAGLERALTGK